MPQLLLEAIKEAKRVCSATSRSAIYIECSVKTNQAKLLASLQNWTCVKELQMGQALALLLRATSG